MVVISHSEAQIRLFAVLISKLGFPSAPKENFYFEFRFSFCTESEREMKKRSRGDDFPLELLEQILSKLPEKSLLRLRTVSKLWNSLISDRKTSDQILGLRREAPKIADGVDGGEKCSLCGMGRLLFAPIPLYCSCCTRIIKPGVNFYKTHTSETQYSFCNSCYKQPSPTGIPVFSGEHRFQKKLLLVAKNIPEIQEPGNHSLRI